MIIDLKNKRIFLFRISLFDCVSFSLLINSHDVQVQKIQVLPKQDISIEDNHSL